MRKGSLAVASATGRDVKGAGRINDLNKTIERTQRW